jgi:hypothetical protein
MNTIDVASADLSPLPSQSARGSLKELSSLDSNPPQQFQDLIGRDPSPTQAPASRGGGARPSKGSSKGIDCSADRSGSTRETQNAADVTLASGSASGSDAVGGGLKGGATDFKKDSQPPKQNGSEDLSPEDAALDAAAFAAAAMFAKVAAGVENSAPLADGLAQEAAPEVPDPESVRLFQSSGRLGVALDSNPTQAGTIAAAGKVAAESVLNAGTGGAANVNLGRVGEGQSTLTDLGNESVALEAGGYSMRSAAETGAQRGRSQQGSQVAVSGKEPKAALVGLERNLIVGAVAAKSEPAATQQDLLKALEAPLAPAPAVVPGANPPADQPIESSAVSPVSSEPAASATSLSADGKRSGEESGGQNGADAKSSGSETAGKEANGKGVQDLQVPSRASGNGRALSSARSGSAGEGQGSSGGRESGARSRSETKTASGALGSALEASELSGLESSKGSAEAGRGGEPMPAVSAMPPRVDAEVLVSKAVVEPPKAVHSNLEVWRTLSDAVERVRSENPSHLAMELRLRDGSTIGVELRMGAAGIEASFKSESQGLLKALESQWTAFLDRQPTDLKVSSTIFEGRMGLNLSSGGGGDAAERREAFEDSAAAASLAFRSEMTDLQLPSEESLAPIPSRSSSRLLNLYA